MWRCHRSPWARAAPRERTRSAGCRRAALLPDAGAQGMPASHRTASVFAGVLHERGACGAWPDGSLLPGEGPDLDRFFGPFCTVILMADGSLRDGTLDHGCADLEIARGRAMAGKRHWRSVAGQVPSGRPGLTGRGITLASGGQGCRVGA